MNVHSLLSQKSFSEDQKHILIPAFRYCAASSSMTVLNTFKRLNKSRHTHTNLYYLLKARKWTDPNANTGLTNNSYYKSASGNW